MSGRNNQRIASRTRQLPISAWLGTVCLVGVLHACQAPSNPAQDSTEGSIEAGAESGRLLGRVEFPNSGAEDAQGDFLKGVLFLHNFEYADARRAFQQALELDPGFVMAAWGEAMTHNHPIWMRQDTEAAIEALARLGASAQEQLARASTDRERAYLHTAHVLFGLAEETRELDKEARDDEFRRAMGELSARYPEDDEARSFYSLSILGTAHEGRDFRTYMLAAAEADRVWESNDQHPGAAHYLIHSFDDPVHAPLGLPMARTYARIAPDAAHAQHMTSHIFVALGLWQDVATANEAARRVQTSRQRELGEPETVCGHYPYWLQYAYLQQNRITEAREVLAACEQRIKAEPTRGERWHYAAMRGRQVLDGPDLESGRSIPLLVEIEAGKAGFSDHLFLSGYLAALDGDHRKASAAASALEKAENLYNEAIPPIQAQQIRGLIQITSGQTAVGLRTLGDAAVAEEALPYAFGPPEVLQPAWELLGNQQLAADQPEKALASFERQLERTPRRVQALQGLSLALDRIGDSVRAEVVRAEIAAIFASGSS